MTAQDKPSEKNERVLAANKHLDGTWILRFPPSAQSVSQQMPDFISFTEAVLAELTEIYLPERGSVTIEGFRDDLPADHLSPTVNEPDESETLSIQTNDPPITIEDIRERVESVDFLDTHHPRISRIEFESGSTEIYLDGELRRISEDSEEIYRTYSVTEGDFVGSPYADPLKVTLRHVSRDFLEPPKNSEYTVMIETETDVWFEDTEVGRINRERIASVFRTLVDELDAHEYYFGSELYWQSQFEEEDYLQDLAIDP